MAIITSSPSVADSRIGYKNLFTTSGVSVTVSSEVTGFEKENAYDWKQYDWWKQSATGTDWLRASFGAAKTADYMAIFGHNLHEVGGSIKPQYSTNGGSTWSDAASAVAPTTGRTLFVGFDATLAADWRVSVTTTSGQSLIAGVMIGEALVFTKGLRLGFAPPTLSPVVEYKTATSELGVHLGGAVKRTGVEGSFSLSNLDPAWVRSDFVPLIDHFNLGYPAVFSWDYTLHPEEAALIWPPRQVTPPNYALALYMDASIQFEGIA